MMDHQKMIGLYYLIRMRLVLKYSQVDINKDQLLVQFLDPSLFWICEVMVN